MLCGARTESKFCRDDIGTVSPQGTNVVSKDYFNVDTNIQETDVLTPDDLVLLYQNCDADPHLVSTTSDIMWPASNEYVETVIHQDQGCPAPDIGSGDSLEDINNILLINNERLNLLNNPSYEMSLDIDQKCEYLDFQHLDLPAECEPNFLLKDSYKQFRILNNMTMELESYELPKSLLDYIYCKRLEDNFNFDMNNIIIYVKNTIEQLKRISNGEFLSEKAKEKWHEVDKCDENVNYEDVNLSVNKVLANTVSIPVYAERKTTNNVMNWDDIVHSEMDLKSLCKLLQKQIILQIPKLVNCPYTLFSKSWDDGVVLRCIKDSKPGKRQTCPRVDVFLQLQRSDSGQLLNNINSIMIFQKSLLLNIQDTGHLNNISKCDANNNKHLDNMEIVMDLNIKEVDKTDINNHHMCSNEVTDVILYKNNNKNVKDKKCEDVYQCETEQLQSSITRHNDFTSIDSTTDLMLSMKQLNMECTVPEETEEQVKALKEIVKFNKRKSPTLKTRIKSPYENKNNALEEKKRKRLLEIRERREKRKLIISENCKMKKNKYGKSFVQAQASSSVTRLSITNKAFYRSIFGDSSGTLNLKTSECNNKDMKITRTTHYKHNDQEHNSIDSILLNNKNDCESSISQSSSEHIPTFTINNGVEYEDLPGILNVQRKLINIDENVFSENKVPSNSPKILIKKTLSSSSISLDFKESINKIYDIIGTKKISDNNVEDGRNVNELNNHKSYTVNSTVLGSDSGTSLKYELTSSISSSYNLNKTKTEKCSKKEIKKVTNFTEPMIPKVVISSKISPGTQEISKNEIINHRKFIDTTINNKNPLKTISRILDQIEDVKKVKNKLKENDKSGNRNTVHNNLKYNIDINRSNKYTVENKPTTTVSSKNCKRKSINSLEKSINIPSVLLTSQFDNINVKHVDVPQNYNISSIIEEAKEARGEAVRGPSKNISRINYLAQPRKLNGAANNEEFQRKYGSNFNVNRIQRFSPPVQLDQSKPIYTTVNKGNKILKKNMKTTDNNKVIEKPLENKDKISTSKSPKMNNSKEFGKKSVSFVKTKEIKINQDTFYTGRINNKLKTREAPTSEKSKSENRFIPTNFGFIEPSLPKNKALYGLQLHKMVNKILNKTELNDLPEDSESNASESPTKQIKVNAEQPIRDLADQENDLKNTIKISKDENEENINIITVTLPTTIINESSIYSNTPSEIQVRDSQFISVQDDGFYSNANSLVKIQPNLLETVSNNVLCDLKLSSSGINLSWPFKSFQFTTVGYAFPNFTAMKPIKKTFLKNTFSSTTNTILMIDKPTQVIEIATTKTEIALQTNFNNILSDRIFLNKSVQYEENFTPNTCKIENNTVVRVTDLDNESDSTSSLDLLVTLLNEIQSITTCQSELMRADTEPFRVHTDVENYQGDIFQDQEHNTLNFNVLNNDENNIDNHHENKQNCLIEAKLNSYKIKTNTKQINSTRFFPSSQTLDAGDCKAIDIKINNTNDNNNIDKENNYNDKIRLNKNNMKTSIISYEDQSRIKIKRDVLVTMYSVLIFTVFAALSIPEILNL